MQRLGVTILPLASSLNAMSSTVLALIYFLLDSSTTSSVHLRLGALCSVSLECYAGRVLQMLSCAFLCLYMVEHRSWLYGTTHTQIEFVLWQ